jgi:hypothetical protein
MAFLWYRFNPEFPFAISGHLFQFMTLFWSFAFHKFDCLKECLSVISQAVPQSLLFCLLFAFSLFWDKNAVLCHFQHISEEHVKVSYFCVDNSDDLFKLVPAKFFLHKVIVFLSLISIPVQIFWYCVYILCYHTFIQ